MKINTAIGSAASNSTAAWPRCRPTSCLNTDLRLIPITQTMLPVYALRIKTAKQQV
jgi:hypothetical protein